MATISENLKTIKDSTMAIKQAILDKGGMILGNLTTYASAIANLPSGEGDIHPTVEKNDVTFYDYDGTIIYSYTAEEFLKFTEMPPLSNKPGLTCQGWNYDITRAKAYVEEYGKLDIGATYITDDGKTRLYIRISAEGRMTVPLYFSQTVDNGVIIDWGDGSRTQTLSGTDNLNISHTYPNIGDYCITLTVASGTLELGHNSFDICVMGSTATNNGMVYCTMLQKAEIGLGVTSISAYAFGNCYSLRSVVIPNSVTTIDLGAFMVCYSLRSVVIPNSVTTIGTNAFSMCSILSSITIPSSVWSIGNAALQYCYALRSVVIPNSVTRIGSGVFQGCSILSSAVIPNSVTSIGNYVFNQCFVLSSAVILNTVRSIGNTMFNNCYSMVSAVIPNSVTSIAYSAFSNCYSMSFYDFSTHTVVPTLANTNAFTGIPSDCKIIVPDGLYIRWIEATNWSAYATYIIKKSEWDNLQ